MKKRQFALFVLALLVLANLSMTVGAEENAPLISVDSDAAKDVQLVQESPLVDNTKREYSQFMEENSAIPMAAQSITIAMAQLNEGIGTFTVLADSVQIDEDGELSVEVMVPQTAMYALEISYMPKPGRSAACELVTMINNEIQYRQAATILVDRIWRDETDTIEVDSNDNDIRPAQSEVTIFSTRRFMDSTGYNTQPLLFKLSEGMNRITIQDNRESILIRELKLCVPETIPTYEEYRREYADQPAATENAPRIQAEKTSWKSDPILTPCSDRTSPLTEPYKGSKISLNTIGQTGWSLTGQTISWNVDAPQDGFYEIRFKAKQNYIRGTYSGRSLMINGQIPFAEAENIRFTYDSSWQLITLGNGTQPYYVYLTKGQHELSMRVTLGDLGEMLGKVDLCANEVNGIYRKFLMLMGSNPDTMRDYKLDRQLPDVFAQMSDLANRLDAVVTELSAITGTKGTELLSLTKMAMTLRDFVKKPYEIPAKFGVFTSSMSALNSWKNEAAYRPLELDYIDIVAPGAPAEKVRPNLWQTIGHGVIMFLASFVEDYDSLGTISDAAQTITVWSTTGRDQAQVLNQLVKSYFSTQNGVNVEIQLVKLDAILPSTVAGNGPDVVLYADQQMPVNFAIRGAAVDLSKFEGFDELVRSFRDSALLPATFNDGIFGLPETETFPMLFYRKDILEEIGVPVPTTWDEVLKIIPDLQKNNMSFLLETGISNSTNNTLGLGTYTMLLYQNGGRLYEGDGIRTLLDSEVAIETFKKWCKLYTNYGLPTNFNAAYRFRTGESPLVVADMSLYNTLMISAPEIKGLWGMTTVPGTNNGSTVEKTVKSSTTYTMLTKTCKNKDAAWAFIKWWLSEETQLAYARDLESLMGTAARYMTANTNAFSRLPWSTKDLKSILEQSTWTIGVPEVAGGYFLPRHINNAFRSVVVNKADPREALITYANIINEELREKRLEFGLPILND